MIKNIVIITAALIVSIILSAYVWYFVGMTVSLTTGPILGIPGTTIAIIFAWIGVGLVVAISLALTVQAVGAAQKGGKEIEINEDDFEKFLKELEGIEEFNRKGGDN